MKKKLLTLIALGIITVGCTKDKSELTNSANTVANMNEMIIDDGFDWKTSHVVKINLTGLPITTQVNKTVVFKNGKDEVILKKLVSLSDNYQFEVEYPDYMDEITMQVDDMVKTARLSNGSVSFDFSKADDRSDLDSQDQ